MKIKKILKISLVVICLLICINNMVYANMSIDAMEKSAWIANRRTNVISLSLIAMIITTLTELIIATFMKMENYEIIFVTNIITQLFLHINTINLFSFNTYDREPIITIFLELIIWFVEFLIYTMMFSESNEKKIFTYVMMANIVTFIAPYIILWNTNNLPNNYNESSVISYSSFDIIDFINFIIRIMYIISLIVTLILHKKVKTTRRIDNEKENISLRKKLLLSKIAIILLGITSFNIVISAYNLNDGIIGFFAPLISFIIIIRIFVHRLKIKNWF